MQINIDEKLALRNLENYVNEPKRAITENGISRIAEKTHLFGEQQGKIILQLVDKLINEISRLERGEQ